MLAPRCNDCNELATHELCVSITGFNVMVEGKYCYEHAKAHRAELLAAEDD